MYQRLTILLLFLATATSGWAASPRATNHKGVEAWQAGKYEEALKQFKEADKNSEEPNLQLRYNMATALAADGQLDEALEAFGEVAGARDQALNNAALYGQGVIAYQQALKEMEAQNLEGAKERVGAAMQSNRAVLRSDPKDNDARVNYEKSSLLKKKIETQMQQQQEKKDDQKKGDENKEEENKDEQKKQEKGENQDEQNKEDGNKEDQSGEQQKQENGEKSDEEKKQEEQKKQDEAKSEEEKQQEEQKGEEEKQDEQKGEQGEEKEMTPEEMAKADQRQATLSILNLLEENDMEALKRMLQQRFGKMKQPKKDW